jgi:hypothetical protein
VGKGAFAPRHLAFSDSPDGHISSMSRMFVRVVSVNKAAKTPAHKDEIRKTIQSDLGRPVGERKIFCFRNTANRASFCVSRTPQEGRFAIVTNVGRGMRWTQ